MFNWIKDYIQTLKNVSRTLSSEQYKLRIKEIYIFLTMATISFVPLAFYFFFTSGNLWWTGFIPLFPLSVAYVIARIVLKSLREGYEQALLRESKQNTKKENENESK